jgi:hypothetical protein
VFFCEKEAGYRGRSGAPLVVKEGVWRMNERREPVRVPEEVMEGLEAVRRYAGTDVLDIE